jgi:hypothetical protein
MGWEEFEQIERQQLRERREGKLRRTLGVPLPGESAEQLDGIGEQDRRMAEQGLVAVMDWGGRISYKHLDDLGRLEMNARTAAERVVDWLKERVERRKLGEDAPPIPAHLPRPYLNRLPHTGMGRARYLPPTQRR